jgi:AraC family transcriptional regulator, regulatory protein of adaptative response / methylated-DNA-[protein]-cysteine methyltransferase
MIRTSDIDTPLGKMVAAATKEGICLLRFADGPPPGSDLEALSKIFGVEVERGENRQLRRLKKQLKEYFTGKRKEFRLRLLTQGTGFQKSVWESLQGIPYGKTISYLEHSRILGNPEAVRAVAHANGENRIVIVIPCHRVIGADGSLVGYGGGLERKRWLIDHEKKYSGQAVDGTLF